MVGEAVWVEPLVVLLGAAAVVVGIRLLVGDHNPFLRQRVQFVCPLQHRRVVATTIEDVSTSRLTDVKRCSGWRLPWRRCEKACLEQLNDGSLSELGLPRRR